MVVRHEPTGLHPAGDPEREATERERAMAEQARINEPAADWAVNVALPGAESDRIRLAPSGAPTLEALREGFGVLGQARREPDLARPDESAEPIIEFKTGATRSADGEDVDFFSLPWLGLFAAARTAAEGAAKHGENNHLRGMPAHKCVNRAIRHAGLWIMGDRSEPHLAHAIWNLLQAQQSELLWPELNAPHLPGPGYTVTPEMDARLDADAPGLAEKREAGLFETLGEWTLAKVPAVARILGQRSAAAGRG